jgi:hypothetical protein
MKAFLLAIALVAAVHAITESPIDSVSCNNGLFCALGQTCMSQEQGAGALLACSPHPSAVVCPDSRYSCPSGTACFNQLCTPQIGGDSFPASLSLDAVFIGSRTYGNGVYIGPTDFPGQVKDLGNDICNKITPLPNYCTCSSWSTSTSAGAEVQCRPTFSFISTWSATKFEPCAIPDPAVAGTERASVTFRMGGGNVIGGGTPTRYVKFFASKQSTETKT